MVYFCTKKTKALREEEKEGDVHIQVRFTPR